MKRAETTILDKEAKARLNKKVLLIQRRFSCWLNGKCSNLSRETLIVMLALLCIGFGSYLILLILGAINNK